MANVPATSKAGKANVPATSKAGKANVPATKPVDQLTEPTALNARPYSGQRLGIELPGGEVVELRPDRVHMALAGSRIIDSTPLTRLPIVVMK